MHVDFVRVRADQTIEAEVSITFTGEAEGVREGGIVEQSLFSLTVEALPRDIPNTIEHDISALVIGDSVHVSDLIVPAGVTITTDPETAVVHISQPRVAEEEAPAEGEAAEGEAAEGEAATGEAPAAEDSSE
jgi:large subunit ribosomal protein L25